MSIGYQNDARMIVNPLTIMHDLGPNADLLLESDQWLENQQQDLATRISMLTGRLRHIQKAQRYKRQLQQVNKVAVRITQRDDSGSIVDEEIRIASLSDAIQLLRTCAPPQDIQQQVAVWHADGYDIATSASLC